MSETTSENLSEVLFKPKLNIIETSTISNSSKDFDNILWGRKGRDWYRLLHYEYWSWLGLDLIEIKAALANMASSTSPRTREQCLDTVCNYGHGNWIFEFSQLGDKYSKIAKSLEEKFLSDDSSLENQEVKKEKIDSKQSFTEPPARYTESKLIKEMETLGIGRPSTYATTVGILSE